MALNFKKNFKTLVALALTLLTIIGTITPTFGAGAGLYAVNPQVGTTTTNVSINSDDMNVATGDIFSMASSPADLDRDNVTITQTLQNTPATTANITTTTTSIPRTLDEGAMTTIIFNGEATTVILGEDGYFHFALDEASIQNVRARTLGLDATYNEAIADLSFPQYFYVDGLPRPIDHPSVVNIIPAGIMSVDYEDDTIIISPLSDTVGVPAGQGLPAGTIVTINEGPIWQYTLSMTNQGRTVNVSAFRYLFMVDGVTYEIYCADPTLAGPENAAAVYSQVGAINHTGIRYALRYGAPHNPYWHGESAAERIWHTYVTRIAVAMAANPSATFTGDQLIVNSAQNLMSGTSAGQNFDETRPAIAVNAVRDATDLGRLVNASSSVAQSETFNVSHNRRASSQRNPFYFEWAAGTPDGARLVIIGGDNGGASVPPAVYVAPNVPSQRFATASPGLLEFRLELPNEAQFEGKTAKIYLVGVHNELAGQVRRLQHPTNPQSWQDMVFYVPYIRASAAFSFAIETQLVEFGSLRPTKIDISTGQIGGGSFIVTGSATASFSGSQTTSGGQELHGLEVGATYMVQYVRDGVAMDTRAVTIQPSHIATPASIQFSNGTTSGNGVTVQKICAITGTNVAGAVIRLQGMSSAVVTTEDGQTISINNTGINVTQVLTARSETAMPSGVASTVIDGVWRLEGLPYGFYQVTEIQSPEGHSLLPGPNSFGFWKLPPNVLIDSPDGFVYNIISSNNDNHIMVTFRNYPFGELEIIKREMSNGVGNNQLLEGATFRLQGFYPSTPPRVLDRTATTDSNGRIIFSNLPAGNFTITEEMPPTGYTFGSVRTWSVAVNWGDSVANGTANSITAFNVPKSSLEVFKICATSNQPLSGAIFELTDPTTGERWQATSRTDGVAIFGVGAYGNYLYPNRTYILREIVSPQGFLLIDEAREIVLSAGVHNRVTIQNYRNPSLTIIKRDAADPTQLLAGAVFSVKFENGQTVAGSPFTTDSQGRIVIDNILGHGEIERTLIVTEVSPPLGWTLSNPNWQRVTVRAGEDNVVTFDNHRMAGLTIQKVDSVTGNPIAGAWFSVEYLGATAGTGNGNIGSSGYLTSSPFITDANGRIFIPNLHSGRYRIVEVRAANGWWLDPSVANRTWIIEIRDNEDFVKLVENTMLPTLVITKWNAVSFRPMPMTQFRVDFEVPLGGSSSSGAGGNFGGSIGGQHGGSIRHIGYFMTDSNGQIILPFVDVGWYILTETRPAPGMSLPSNPVTRVFLSAGQNTYQILHLLPDFGGGFAPPTGDSNSGSVGSDSSNNNSAGGNSPDIGAGYSGSLADSGTGDNGSSVNYESSGAGQVSTPPPSAVNGFTLAQWEAMNEAQRAEFLSSGIQVTDGNSHLVNSSGAGSSGIGGTPIFNWPLNSIVIKKTCSVTGRLLPNATFNVIHTSAGVSGTLGTSIGRFTTGASGIIVITGLVAGSYVIIEETPPPNFTLSVNNTQTVFLAPDGHSVVEVNFANDPYGSLLISKRCEVTNAPLQNAVFRVTNSSGTVVGTANGLHRTNAQGEILIPNLPPDSYVVSEVESPAGWVLDSTPQTIRVEATGQVYQLHFTNHPLSSLIIRKECEETGRPLIGARFTVSQLGSELPPQGGVNQQGSRLIGEFVTDASGTIEVRGVLGWMVIEETHPPQGYSLAVNNVQTVYVGSGEPTIATFRNPRLSNITLRKISDYTNLPMANVVFEITRFDGTRIRNPIDNSFEFVTNSAGLIHMPSLESGVHIARELRTAEGYLLAEPYFFTVVDNQDLTITIRNYRYSSLTILKRNSVTHEPLAGVWFEISRPDGTRVINPATGFHTFITDSRGIIHLPALSDGVFYLHETRALNGFLVDEEVIPFYINAEARRRAAQGQVGAGTNPINHLLVVENTPASGLLIIKTCAMTGLPLENVYFEVRHADGRLVTGQMLHGNQPNTPANSPQLGANGLFVTDSRGRINLNHLPAGVYHVHEVRGLTGYQVDDRVHVVTLIAGQQTVLEVENVPLGGVRLLKVCAFSGRPLHNVEFMVFDRFGNVVGVFYTDNNGLIDFGGILVEGRYTIRETRPAQGFFRDDVPRTIEITAGVITEILWENVPYAGQIQILKVSADYNEINGLPAGTPLEGAIFEIRDQRTGNLVDRIISDHRGMAVSRPLPLGRYLVEEVQAPQFYILNTRVVDVTIEFATQIMRLEFANQSANLGVSVTKTGPQTVMAGQNHVVYEIRRLRNDSTVALSDFFFREIFPTDAFRVERIVTGTFNISLRYRVEATTNTGRTVVVNDNLMTTRNNVLDMRPAALGLAANEFVTELVFLFGQVPAGFSMVQAPRIEGRILNHTFPNGFQFANRVDVGGRHGGEWIVQQSRVVTEVLVPQGGRIPQTGW